MTFQLVGVVWLPNCTPPLADDPGSPGMPNPRKPPRGTTRTQPPRHAGHRNLVPLDQIESLLAIARNAQQRRQRARHQHGLADDEYALAGRSIAPTHAEIRGRLIQQAIGRSLDRRHGPDGLHQIAHLRRSRRRRPGALRDQRRRRGRRSHPQPLRPQDLLQLRPVRSQPCAPQSLEGLAGLDRAHLGQDLRIEVEVIVAQQAGAARRPGELILVAHRGSFGRYG